MEKLQNNDSVLVMYYMGPLYVATAAKCRVYPQLCRNVDVICRKSRYLSQSRLPLNVAILNVKRYMSHDFLPPPPLNVATLPLNVATPIFT